MARSRRKRGNANNNQTFIYIGCGLAVAVIGFMLFKSGSSDATVEKSDFSAETYMNRGSVAVGNTYRLPATVAEVHSHGGSRIIEVLTQDHKRIGLFVPANTTLKSNVRVNMDYVFTVQGRNGTMPDGSPVKGILVVTEAEAK